MSQHDAKGAVSLADTASNESKKKHWYPVPTYGSNVEVEPWDVRTYIRYVQQDLDMPVLIRDTIAYAFSFARKYHQDSYRYKTFGPDIDIDDLYQELIIALFIADSKYDAQHNPERWPDGAPFFPFLKKCLRSCMYHLFQRHAPERDTIPLEFTITSSSDDYTGNTYDDEELLEDKRIDIAAFTESVLQIADFARTLTPLQRQIVEYLHMVDDGASDADIAMHLGTYQVNIWRNRQRILKAAMTYAHQEDDQAWLWFMKGINSPYTSESAVE
jgi:DNA-directed RNA polymerase specialized sigma24 family protein